MQTDNIYNIDCLDGMRQMEAESVDLTVTSPPYDNLRTYNGYCFDFENIARELYRVTKQGGVVVWVVGDATIDGSETGTSFRQALFFMECGFRLHDTMIYEKGNPLPLHGKRYLQSFEYMFVLSKGTPEVFNPIKVPCKYAGQCNFGKRSIYTNESNVKESRRKVISDEKIRSNIFTYNVGSLTSSAQINHPAMFPLQLAKDQILSWSNLGGVILDPFMGSGTTAIAARALGRHYIGFEISAEYCDIIRQRLEQTRTLFD